MGWKCQKISSIFCILKFSVLGGKGNKYYTLNKLELNNIYLLHALGHHLFQTPTRLHFSSFSEYRTSSKDFISQLVVLANLVGGKHLKVPLEQTSKLQQCFLVSLLIGPSVHGIQDF